MATKTVKVTLTEKNDAGPLFDLFYSINSGSSFTSSDDSTNLYLPYTGASAVANVDELANAYDLRSKGVCVNSQSDIFPTPTPTATIEATPTATPTPTPTNPFTSSRVYTIGAFSGQTSYANYIDPYGTLRNITNGNPSQPTTFVAQVIVDSFGPIEDIEGPIVAPGPYGNFASTSSFDVNDSVFTTITMDVGNFRSKAYWLDANTGIPMEGEYAEFSYSAGYQVNACMVSGSLVAGLQFNTAENDYYDYHTITTTACAPTPTPTPTPSSTPTPTPTPTPSFTSFGFHNINKSGLSQFKCIWSSSSQAYQAYAMIQYLTGQSGPTQSTPYAITTPSVKIWDSLGTERVDINSNVSSTVLWYYNGTQVVVEWNDVAITGTYSDGSTYSDTWGYQKD